MTERLILEGEKLQWVKDLIGVLMVGSEAAFENAHMAAVLMQQLLKSDVDLPQEIYEDFAVMHATWQVLREELTTMMHTYPARLDAELKELLDNSGKED